MTAPAVKAKLSMCCWIEQRRAAPERRAAWHADCVIPTTCPCPAHQQVTNERR